MSEDPALAGVIERAVRLSDEWLLQPRPNEDPHKWDLQSLDIVARKVKLLGEVDEYSIIGYVTELSRKIEIPNISYEDATKEMVALKARAGDLSHAVWAVGIAAQDAGYSQKHPSTFASDDIRYSELLKETAAKIDLANTRLAELEKLARENSQFGLSISFGPVAIDVALLRNAINMLLKVTGSNKEINAELLEEMLASAKDFAEDILRHFSNLKASIAARAKKISIGLAQAAYEAWRAGAQIVHKVAENLATRTKISLHASITYGPIDVTENQDDLANMILNAVVNLFPSRDVRQINFIEILTETGQDRDQGVVRATVTVEDALKNLIEHSFLAVFRLTSFQLRVFSHNNFVGELNFLAAKYNYERSKIG